MLDRIIQFSVRNKLIIGIFILGLIGYGAYEVTKLPIDAVPDITDNQVQVITISPSLGAPDVERFITFPVEQANSNIPGIKEIRSFSRFGLSLVTIVFDDKTDVYWARQQVAERLQQVQAMIPKGLGIPEMGPVTTGLGEIYQYVLRTKPGYEKAFDITELRTMQDWIVRRQLLGTPGVADVSSFGGLLKQYEVAVDPARLNASNITMEDLFTALEKNNQNTGGAYIEKGPTVLYIRSEGLVGSPEDIGNIVIKSLSNGVPLLVRDVAEVRIGAATRYGALTYNDLGEATGGVVMMLKGGNSSDVIDEVKRRVEQIQKSLPEGVVIEPFLDRTKMVNNAIHTVEKNLAEGALIVILVLVLFLGNMRAGLLVASVIPLAMLFAIIMMNTFHVGGNLMSLGALDFGLIVDGAVIIVEAVLHRLSHSKQFSSINKLSQEQMDGEVEHSSSRMMNAAVFGQIIILIVYLPILSLQGIEGKMFKPMAQTVAFAIIGAFLLSLTYVPMMSALFLSKKIKHKPTFSDRAMIRVEKFYQHLLERLLNHKKKIIFASFGMFAIALVLLMGMGGEFIPKLEEGDFAVDTRVLTGSNLNTTIKATTETAHILLENFPEVEKVVTKIGSGEIPTDPMPIEASDMMVILKDKSEWTSAETFNELAEKMSAKLQDLPGVTFGFQYPVQMRFNELMTGARQDVVCKIFGEDLDTLAKYAEKLGGIIETVEGAKDLYVESVTGMPQIVVNYKREELSKYGLTITDVNTVLNTAFAGQSAGLVFEGEKRFDLVVRMDNEKRKSVDDVRNLLVRVSSGMQIPMHQLADINVVEGPNQIQREDAKRRIVIGFNVRGRDVQSIVQELQGKVDKSLKLPVGYYTTYGGAFENLQAAKARLSIALPIALFLIFLMLYFAFKSVREGLMIYSAIPLSAIGGVFALAIFGMPFSISAGVGFIALFGVAVLNGIVLISEFNRLKAEGLHDPRRIVITGTKIRLRPVLMTAAVASLGFLPMALSNGAGAEVQRPLATVVIGGLITATLLTLFVLPCLYVLFEGRKMAKLNTKAAASVIVLLLGFSAANAQSVDLNSALTQAEKDNMSLKIAKLNASQMQVLSTIKMDVSKFSVTGEYGQINSFAQDNRFVLGQQFSFPTVYTHSRKMYEASFKSALAEADMTKAQLRYEVRSNYYTWTLMQERKKLLAFEDSIFGKFAQYAQLRLDAGETSRTENAFAQNQRLQISQQQSLLASDMAMTMNRMKVLLSAQGELTLAPVPVLYPFLTEVDTAFYMSHPQYVAQQQALAASKEALLLEKARLMPDINLGYANMTIKGWQNIDGTDRFYGPSSRFSTVSAGLQLPLFYGAQRKKAAAAEIRMNQEELHLAYVEQLLLEEYNSALSQWKQSVEVLNTFDNAALQNADQITTTATQQLQNGEINYLDWVVLVSQSLTVRTNYFDAVMMHNDAAFRLESLLNK